MLRDSVGNYMNSWVELEHVNGETSMKEKPVFKDRATVRISYLGVTAYS